MLGGIRAAEGLLGASELTLACHFWFARAAEEHLAAGGSEPILIPQHGGMNVSGVFPIPGPDMQAAG